MGAFKNKRKLVSTNILNFSVLHLTRNFAEHYEGDGKTKIHIMNNDSELGLMVNGYSQVRIILF